MVLMYIIFNTALSNKGDNDQIWLRYSEGNELENEEDCNTIETKF